MSNVHGFGNARLGEAGYSGRDRIGSVVKDVVKWRMMSDCDAEVLCGTASKLLSYILWQMTLVGSGSEAGVPALISMSVGAKRV